MELLEDYLEGCSESFDLAERGVRDVDFDWFSRDTQGSVALLTTGGHLVVPRSVFRSKDAYLRVCEVFYRTPERGQALLKQAEPGDFEDWLAASRRGFYGYDWNNDTRVSDTYSLVSVPAKPISVTELPEVAEYLVRFSGAFSTASTVSAADFG